MSGISYDLIINQSEIEIGKAISNSIEKFKKDFNISVVKSSENTWEFSYIGSIYIKDEIFELRDTFNIELNDQDYIANHPSDFWGFLVKNYNIKVNNSISIYCSHSDKATRKICISVINLLLDELQHGMLELIWISDEIKREISEDIWIKKINYSDTEFNIEIFLVDNNFVKMTLDKQLFLYE
jgi:hypothetical protein